MWTEEAEERVRRGRAQCGVKLYFHRTNKLLTESEKCIGLPFSHTGIERHRQLERSGGKINGRGRREKSCREWASGGDSESGSEEKVNSGILPRKETDYQGKQQGLHKLEVQTKGAKVKLQA